MTSCLLDPKRTLPEVLEQRARTDPNGLYAKVPLSSTTYSAGFRNVTNSEVAKAVDRVAWLLERELGRAEGFPTIAYLAPADLRYSIVIMAAIKTGYKAFLPSPRNSKAAFLSLLSRLACRTLLTVSPEPPSVPLILAEYEAKKITLPSLFDLLDSRKFPRYPYNKPFAQAATDPFLVLHTSGSTGIPKPLTYTNEFVARVARNASLHPPKGYRSLDVYFRAGHFFIFLPPFHIAGIAFSLIVPTFWSCIPIYPLAGAPPTLDGLLEATDYTHADWAFIAPVMVDIIGKTPSLLEAFASKFKHLFYSGGSVPKPSGDVVAARMGLYQVLGSSECGHFPLIRSEEDKSCKEWDCVQVHPAVNTEFRHRFDGLHELVVIRSEESKNHQPCFLHFPEQHVYETRDLFEASPGSADSWVHRSRIDDVIVFLNGEKTNPVSFEQEVGSHPEVRSALVAGMQRFEASLLVELTDYSKSLVEGEAAVVNRIWPIVEKANNATPAHARVAKSKIIIVDPAMPMMRAGKGTVQRQATWSLYAKRLQMIYTENETAIVTTAKLPDDFDITDVSMVAQIVQDAAARIMQRDKIGKEDDFFSIGMDSLMVLRLTRELKAQFGLPTIETKTIYGNPFVDKLASEITKLASDQTLPNRGQPHSARESVMEAMLKLYESQVDSYQKVVLLTGSTGAVGSFLLHELLNDDSVAHIYCLNRTKDSGSVQTKRSAQRGLSTDFPPARVSFLTTNLSENNFGLPKGVLNEMSTRVTHIVLNAWPVDFNLPLSTFKSSLDGMLNMITFAKRSPKSPKVLFISSISAMTSYPHFANAQTQIPETIVDAFTCPANMGYGESKYVAERMLDYAARKLNINASIVRVGQIAGTAENPRGWNRNEWLPSLVLSSNFLRMLPESLGSRSGGAAEGMMGTIDWLPIDRLTEIIVELLFARPSEDAVCPVFHAVNPQTTTWTKLLPAIQTALTRPGADRTKVVPFEKWLERLKLEADEGKEITTETIKLNPGVRLLDFYDSLTETKTRAGFSTERTSQVSKTLDASEAVKSEWMAGWVKGWLADV